MNKLENFYNIVTAEDLANKGLNESVVISSDDRRYFKDKLRNISKYIAEYGRERIEKMLLDTTRGHWKIGADNNEKFPEAKYKTIISTLIDEQLDESVYDVGDIGHPSRNTIYNDIDIELEKRNGLTKELNEDEYLSKDDFIQKCIDLVQKDVGQDLELDASDLNLVYRSMISDPEYDSYDITKNEILKKLEKKVHESFVLKEKTKEEKQNKFDYVMGEFGRGELHSSDGSIVTDKKQALAIAYSESGLGKDKEINEEQTSILGYTYNDLLPLITIIGENATVKIIKGNVLIEGNITEFTDKNIKFEYKNRNYNIVK